MRSMSTVLLAVGIACVLCSAAISAPMVLGSSGLMFVPGDTVLKQSAFNLSANTFRTELHDTDDSFRVNTYAVNYGIWKNLEVGACLVDPKEGDKKVLLNAKYLAVAETIQRPSITVGVVDAGSQLHKLTGSNDDPGVYIVFSKNATATAETVARTPSKPVRAHLGFGMGVYDGVFAGLDFVIAPKVSAFVEYLSSGLRDKGGGNTAIRYEVSPGLMIEGGFVNFQDACLGVSYQAVKF